MSAGSEGLRPGGRLAPFGRETLYVAALYFRQAAIFTALGLAIVLSLDGANNYGVVMSPAAAASGLDGPGRLAFYLSLRGLYVLPSILPIAAIVGAVWAEFMLASSRERIMIANSGRSPLRSMIPAVVFGLLLGLIQFGAIAYGRPAAVEAQGSSNFRYYGPRFQQPAITEPQWIAAGQAVIHARIEIDGIASLRDVLVYSFDGAGRLEAIVSAERAVPGPSAGMWTFVQGSSWDVSETALRASRATAMTAADFASLRRPLALDPIWLRNVGVLPPLLPQGDLVHIAELRPPVPNASEYQAAFHERFAGIFLCVGMALLGASLSMRGFFPGMGPMPALRIGIAGGIAYVGSNAASMLGTYGSAPPLAAAWTMPALFILVAIVLPTLPHWQVRRRLAQAFTRP